MSPLWGRDLQTEQALYTARGGRGLSAAQSIPLGGSSPHVVNSNPLLFIYQSTVLGYLQCLQNQMFVSLCF